VDKLLTVQFLVPYRQLPISNIGVFIILDLDGAQIGSLPIWPWRASMPFWKESCG